MASRGETTAGWRQRYLGEWFYADTPSSCLLAAIPSSMTNYPAGGAAEAELHQEWRNGKHSGHLADPLRHKPAGG